MSVGFRHEKRRPEPDGLNSWMTLQPGDGAAREQPSFT